MIDFTLVARALAVWLGLVAAAIANGTLRVALLEPRLGAAAAHVASTLALCVLVLLVARLAIGWIAPSGARAAWGVGGLWVGSTVAFEFGFGRQVAGKSWAELLADYDLSRGRVWILVLVVTAAAPALAWRWRRRQ